MNIYKKILRNAVLVLVAVMLLTIPNMPVYSSVGAYQSNSLALAANKNYNLTTAANGKVVWPAILAVAAGVGLAAFFVIGVMDGWNSIHPSPKLLASLDFDKNYDEHDFSKFDN